jgi:hypothetical protein
MKRILLLLMFFSTFSTFSTVRAQPHYAISKQTWTVKSRDGSIRQIWSAPIAVPECNKTDYNGTYADCRNNYSNGGHLYSWFYVSQKADALCPYPWRVPTVNDLRRLLAARGSGGGWGGENAGYAHWTGQLKEQYESYCFYSIDRKDDAVAWYVYGSHDTGPNEVKGCDVSSGLQVRCVRDE